MFKLGRTPFNSAMSARSPIKALAIAGENEPQGKLRDALSIEHRPQAPAAGEGPRSPYARLLPPTK
jgi:hypothetical protein